MVDGHFAAWKLQKDWHRPGVNIGWAEMAAVEQTLAILIGHGVRNCMVAFRSDNNGIVFALQAGQSWNKHQNMILMCILASTEEHGIDIQISYVRSTDNSVDAPSRGVAPSGIQMIDWPFSTPPKLVPFVTQTLL